MPPTCPGCNEVYQEGDTAQTLGPTVKLCRGEKSGELYWKVINEMVEHPHVECLPIYCNFEDSPIFDEIDQNFRERVRRDEREMIKDELRQHYADTYSVPCCDCLEDMEMEDVTDALAAISVKVQGNPKIIEALSYEDGYRLWQYLDSMLRRRSAESTG